MDQGVGLLGGYFNDFFKRSIRAATKRTLHQMSHALKWSLGVGLTGCFLGVYSLLQQPGPKKFNLSNTELIYKAKKFKVPPFTV